MTILNLQLKSKGLMLKTKRCWNETKNLTQTSIKCIDSSKTWNLTCMENNQNGLASIMIRLKR